MKCYNCDTEIHSEWNYCPNCKKVLRKHKIVPEQLIPCNEAGKCHQCSVSLDGNWNFCPICGDTIDFYENSSADVVIPIAVGNTNILGEEGPKVECAASEQTTFDVVGYCMHCGSPMGEGHLFCAVCGAQNERVINSQSQNTQIVEQPKKPDAPGKWYILLVVLWAICQFYPIIDAIFKINSPFSAICFPGSIVSILVAKWLYPNNKLVHYAFITFIVLVILMLLAWFVSFFLAFFACYSCIVGLGSIGG